MVWGFISSSRSHARILVPREDDDVDRLRNGLELAAVKVLGSGFNGGGCMEVVELSDVARLADLVESKAYAMLPGAYCQGCGYKDCRSLEEAILSGKADATMCVRSSTAFILKVNSKSTLLNSSARRVLASLIKTLKGGKTARRWS
jgi:Na+-translocating ferredoxin:NAD+ oxidoreductase RNF subunit RnfB